MCLTVVITIRMFPIGHNNGTLTHKCKGNYGGFNLFYFSRLCYIVVWCQVNVNISVRFATILPFVLYTYFVDVEHCVDPFTSVLIGGSLILLYNKTAMPRFMG